jgi:hypothetical protein
VLGLISGADAEESESKSKQEQEPEPEASALPEARNLNGNGGCGEEHVDTGGKSRGAEKSKVQGELGRVEENGARNGGARAFVVVVAQRNVKGVSEWFPAAALERRRFDSPVRVAICKPHARWPLKLLRLASATSAAVRVCARIHGHGEAVAWMSPGRSSSQRSRYSCCSRTAASMPDSGREGTGQWV